MSFAAMISVGTCLLVLPQASQSGQSVGWLNALFTATSANCVTGLTVVNTMTQWTLFGQLVILALIQLGGIGFITIVTGTLLVFKRRITLRQRINIQAMFNQNSLFGMTKLVQRVLRYTFAIEAVGAIALTIGFLTAHQGYTVGQAIWYGIFHAVSAFCNAGFDIIGGNSFTAFVHNDYIQLVLMVLITLGGFGFAVLHELRQFILHHGRFRKRTRHLSLQTKLVLKVSLGLFLFGTLAFAAVEWGNPQTFGHFTSPQKWFSAAFESVTLRTAGFVTIDQNALTDLSELIASALMLIGGSPAGTTGGIKTITLAIIIIAVNSAVHGRTQLVVSGRRLPVSLLQKALAIVAMMVGITCLAVFALYFTEAHNAFHPTVLDLIFEACSAVGTGGLTTGMTPHLSVLGKLIITACMFIGRLSPLTIAVALNIRIDAHQHLVEYPEENLIVG